MVLKSIKSDVLLECHAEFISVPHQEGSQYDGYSVYEMPKQVRHDAYGKIPFKLTKFF